MQSHATCPFQQLLSQSEEKPVRRANKRVHDPRQIEALLTKARTGCLGLVDTAGTYVVPLNYVWKDEKIYFHGSEAGRKFDALQKPLNLCFTVMAEQGTVVSSIPAHIGTAYFSVMVFGHIRQVTTITESTAVLQAMLDKYVPKYFSNPLSSSHVERYRSSMGSKTIVFALEPETITAKEDSAPVEKLFYPGRKVEQDL
ncbi:pyridoxamine 5'-phosphate oxidase family protein [Hazenella sp. IB182353]|uniref:pyridoxamine 5'-phosphate oxidase family protein n=1 Tax=Polycladospora coralii TaxID=2771432 RepID=UPI0017460E93|nr:pyridoxamine 5'-phosphate oxidase family protein [Polycladospora coralii]MBS7531139.1 pyridoxamine 5'-phosphate oxidase family protein [Polycladospora coralii]